MCGEPLHQLRLGCSHLTQSLFSNETRAISCTHRNGCFKETVNGKTPSTNMQSKWTKPNSIDDICGQGWDVPTTTMVCALELHLLTAAQHSKKDLTIQLRTRAKFKPCRVVSLDGVSPLHHQKARKLVITHDPNLLKTWQVICCGHPRFASLSHRSSLSCFCLEFLLSGRIADAASRLSLHAPCPSVTEGDFKAPLGQIHFILNGFLISWPLCLPLRIRAGVLFMSLCSIQSTADNLT